MESNNSEAYKSLDRAVRDMRSAGMDQIYVSDMLKGMAKVDADVAEHMALYKRPQVNYNVGIRN